MSKDVIKFFYENYLISDDVLFKIMNKNIGRPETIKYILGIPHLKFGKKHTGNILLKLLNNIRNQIVVDEISNQTYRYYGRRIIDSNKKMQLIIESMISMIKSGYFPISSEFLIEYKHRYMYNLDNDGILYECIN
jgi:hypothetical protein